MQKGSSPGRTGLSITKRRNQQVTEQAPNSPVSPTQQPHLMIGNEDRNSTNKINSSSPRFLLDASNLAPEPCRVVPLVSCFEGSLHFHDEAAHILQKYSEQPVCFVGLWGSQHCNKGAYYDEALQLCGLGSGQYLSEVSRLEDEAQIYLLSRPVIKGGLRVFLLDCRGYEKGDLLESGEKNRLDFMLSLCQVIIFVEGHEPTSSNFIERAYSHLSQSFHRLHTKGRKNTQATDQLCWPNSLLLLYSSPLSLNNTSATQQVEDQLADLFQDFNFSIYHPQPSISNQASSASAFKHVELTFTEIYNKCRVKTYQSLLYSGQTCPHIVSESAHQLNQHGCLRIGDLMPKAKKSIFLTLYNRHALSYVLKMKEHIREEKPYGTDYLIGAFREAGQEVREEYGREVAAVLLGADPVEEQYRGKLEDFIEEKQANILAVNAKKSLKKLDEVLQVTRNENPQELLAKLQQTIVKQDKQYDDKAASMVVASVVKKFYDRQTQGQPNAEFILKQDSLAVKRSALQKRKAELQVLASLEVQRQKTSMDLSQYKQEEQDIQNEIRAEKHKFQVLRSKAGSQNSEGKAWQIRSQIVQLQKNLNSKLSQKKALQAVLKSKEVPQASILQSRLKSTQQQINKIKSSNIQAGKGESPFLVAERRIVTGNQTIRKVSQSRI